MGDSLIVETTMTSVDVDLAIVVAGGSVGSWRRCTDRRFLVVGACFVSKNTGPGKVADLEPPAVV